MAELVADCPRCRATRTTFDVLSDVHTGWRYNWQPWYEAFSVCRHCNRSTVFVLSARGIDEKDEMVKAGGPSRLDGSINGHVSVESFISLKDAGGIEAPGHLPEDIKAAFKEGATSLSVECPNAAGTMFRLCVDLATRPLLPKEDVEGLNQKVRRDLGLRLPWLFDHGKLPQDLKGLSSCVKEDGNDGAHRGTLQKEDAEDLLDFTTALLERMYTEPQRLVLATKRRADRRKPKETE